MISSFYLSRFTADRLGGGKKCIDFVFKRQWPLAAFLRPNKTLLSVLLKTRIKRGKKAAPVGAAFFVFKVAAAGCHLIHMIHTELQLGSDRNILFSNDSFSALA